MPSPRYVFTLVSGHYFRTRSIGFIEELTQGGLDAKQVYGSLTPKTRSTVDSRFKHWLDGEIFDKYFHRFDGHYSSCFTFKWEERRIPQRLYGFCCHPKPKTEPSFELCSLMYFDTKADKTNYTILGWINQLSVHPLVKLAIGQQYPEFIAQGGGKKWTH
jgi:hypothetical protein